MVLKRNDWFMIFKPNSNASIRLFCFHHGGGSASIYRCWVKDIIDSVEIVAIQLPGREERYNEQLLNNINIIINELYLDFNEYTDKPFVLFGHSLGALVAFEFARALRRNGRPQPKHLIVSGAKAPQIPLESPNIHSLSDSEFIQELRKYNGVSQSMMENKELISVFLPAMKSDFCMYETYEYRNESPLSYPITALGGLDDETFRKENLIEWKIQTIDSFKYYFLPGNHFFIKSAHDKTIKIVNLALKETILSLK